MRKYILEERVDISSWWLEFKTFDTKEEALEVARKLVKDGKKPSSIRVVKKIVEFIPAFEVIESED